MCTVRDRLPDGAHMHVHEHTHVELLTHTHRHDDTDDDVGDTQFLSFDETVM